MNIPYRDANCMEVKMLAITMVTYNINNKGYNLMNMSNTITSYDW